MSTDSRVLVQGTRGEDFAELVLDDEWQGLDVTLTFEGSGYKASPERREDGTYEIPYAAMVRPGEVIAYADGVTGDGTRLKHAAMGKPFVTLAASGPAPDDPQLKEQWEAVRDECVVAKARAQEAATSAEASEAAAKSSESAAKASEDAAKASQSASKASETASGTSAQAARQSAADAATEAQKAASSASEAASSAQGASASAETAKDEADRATQRAADAEAAEGRAQEAADSATTSAAQAQESATVAQQKAEAAAASATDAEGHASASAASAAEAAKSAEALKAVDTVVPLTHTDQTDYGAMVTGGFAFAVGQQAEVKKDYSVAVGEAVKNDVLRSTVVGINSQADYGSKDTNDSAVVVGNSCFGYGYGTTVLGTAARAASGGVTIGYRAMTPYDRCVTVGPWADGMSSNGTVIGCSTATFGVCGVAIGYGAFFEFPAKADLDLTQKGFMNLYAAASGQRYQKYSVALGAMSSVRLDEDFVVSVGSDSLESGIVKLGYKNLSRDDGTLQPDSDGNYYAYNDGYYKVKTGFTRRIIHVTDPINDQDAMTKHYADRHYPQQFLRGTASGQVVHVEDAFEGGRVLGLSIKGRTEQVTTTGANLWPQVPLTTDKGVTFAPADDGDGHTDRGLVKVSGTATAANACAEVQVSLGAGTYSFKNFGHASGTSASDAAAVYLRVRVVPQTGSQSTYTAFGNAATTFSVASGDAVFLDVMVGAPGVVTGTQYTVRPMLVSGSSMPSSWEQYTGGEASPSVRYPQRIHNSAPTALHVSSRAMDIIDINAESNINVYIRQKALMLKRVSFIMSNNALSDILIYVHKENGDYAGVVKIPAGKHSATVSPGAGWDKIIIYRDVSIGMPKGTLLAIVAGESDTFPDEEVQALSIALPETHKYLAEVTGSGDAVSVDASNGSVQLSAAVKLEAGVSVQAGSVEVIREGVHRFRGIIGQVAKTDSAIVSNVVESEVDYTFPKVKGVAGYASGNILQCAVADASFGTTEESIKTELDKHSPEVMYQLAQPEVTDLGNITLPKIPGSSMVVWCDGDVSPEIELVYERDINIAMKNLETAVASVTA